MGQRSMWNILFPSWLCAVSQEIAEELLSDSSEEEVLTTRVVRRRVIIQVKLQLWRQSDWHALVCGSLDSLQINHTSPPQSKK